jgi:hypothetical protein
MFQSVYFAQGYLPYRATAYVTYAYRSLLATFLFFGLFLRLLPTPGRSLAGGAALTLFLAATVFYFGLIVSRRPELVQMNDRAEALGIGVTSLLRGQYPYLQKTQLNNLLSPLTVPFLLALPGQLLFHRPELMNLPMLALAFAGLAWQCRRAASPVPLSLLAMALFLNPLVIWELTLGGDLIWGGVLLLLAGFALDASLFTWAAFLFASTLCCRTVYFLLIPMWGLFLLRHHRALAARLVLIAVLTVLVFELPLILWNPRVFLTVAPLGLTGAKLSLPAPAGDNLLADLLNHLLPASPFRTVTLTLFLGALSGLIGWRARTVTDLFLGTATLLALGLFFMGPYFLVDYLVWILLPLFGALAGHTSSRSPLAPGFVESRRQNLPKSQ